MNAREAAAARDAAARARLAADPVERLRDAGTCLAGLTIREPSTKLTALELDVLRLIAEGCTNAEIAADHVKSVETVKSQVKTIIRKLDARSRTHAVVIALRSGVLDLDAIAA